MYEYVYLLKINKNISDKNLLVMISLTIFFVKLNYDCGYNYCLTKLMLWKNSDNAQVAIGMSTLCKTSLTFHHKCAFSPGYWENSPDLQGTLKLHMWLYNRISRLQKPHSKNWHAHYALCPCCMATNASKSHGEFTRDLSMCVFLASVACPPQLPIGSADAVRYTHMCLPRM